MTIEEKLIDEIRRLSEMEFSTLLREMAAHLRREKWEHMINDCFDIETYEQDYENAKEELLDVKHKLREAEKVLNKIRELV